MQRSKIKGAQCCTKTSEVMGSHFYRIIDFSCVQDQRLAIPRKFIRKFGKKLSNTAVLEIPSKQKWHVELREYEGQVWFEKGLHEFMEYHSINQGHILVFRYDGFSRFRVVVFDMSGSEITYPCDTNDLEEQNTVFGCKTPNYSTRTAETISAVDPGFRRQRDEVSAKRKSPTSNPGYLSRNNEKPDGFLSSEHQCNDQVLDPCGRGMKRPGEFVGNRETHSTKQDGCEVFGFIFKAFDQEGPLRFDCMEHHEETNLNCSPDFTSMKHSESDTPTMSNSGPSLKRRQRAAEGRQTAASNLLNRSIFTESKTVEMNSNSTMQEIRTKKPRAELVSVPKRSMSFPPKGKAKIAARTFTSKFPFCSVTMRPSYVFGSSMAIPNWFSKKYLKEEHQNANLRGSDGKTWKARLTFGSLNVKLRKGWRKFVSDNHLEEDDICIFELVDRDHIELRVTIFRISGQTKNINCHASDLVRKLHKRHVTRKKRNISDGKGGNGKEDDAETHFTLDNNAETGLSSSKRQRTGEADTPTMSNSVGSIERRKEIIEDREINNSIMSCGMGNRHKEAQKKERAILAAIGFTSTNPFCTVTMRSSYVRGTFYLSLPKPFADKYLKEGFRGVNLRVSNEGVWRAHCGVNEPRRLSSGWKKFVLDNHLEEDDTCIFELVDREHLELNVFIFRSHVHTLQLSS